jgi:hypothetical protein
MVVVRRAEGKEVMSMQGNNGARISYLIKYSEHEGPVEVFQAHEVRGVVEQYVGDGGLVVIGINLGEPGVLIGASVGRFEGTQEVYQIFKIDELGAAVGLLYRVFGHRVRS